MLAADQVGVAALTDRKGGSLANRWDRVRVARWSYLLAALAIAIGVRWLTRPLCRAALAPLAVLPGPQPADVPYIP